MHKVCDKHSVILLKNFRQQKAVLVNFITKIAQFTVTAIWKIRKIIKTLNENFAEYNYAITIFLKRHGELFQQCTDTLLSKTHDYVSNSIF